MAEGPLPLKHQRLERDAQEEQEGLEEVASSSTKDSGSRKNFTSTSDKSRSVKSDIPPSFLLVENTSFDTYESRDGSRRTDSDIKYIDNCRRNPPRQKSVKGGRSSRRRPLPENRTNRAQSRQPTGTSAITASRSLRHVGISHRTSYQGDVSSTLDQPDTGNATSAAESGASQSFCSEPNRSSHCDNPYKYHGCCPEKCTNFMFNAILHCSLLDVDFAHEVKRELETLTLPFLGQNYRPRVALLYSLTRKPPLEAFDEIKSSKMTTNIIILRTENYRTDEKAKATGMKIRDEACGTSLEVTTLYCSPPEKTESRCDAIHYRPKSESFRADMINILLGKYFWKQLYHDGCRRQCKKDGQRNLPLQHSESFTEHSAAGTRQRFQRTHSLPNTSNSMRTQIHTRKNQNDENAGSELSTDDTESSSTKSNQRRIGTLSSQDSQTDISGMKSERSTETSAASGSDNNALISDFTKSELSSASGFNEEVNRMFNPIPSSETSFSDSSDGRGYRPHYSKIPIVHPRDPSRLNKHESSSSSQEWKSDCQHEIKKPKTTKEGGTGSNRRQVAAVSPMSTVLPDKADHQTVQKTHWTAGHAETELSLSNQEGVTQLQGTRNHQNSYQNQQNATTDQSTSSPQHSTGHQARQQTTDVQQCITEQQHPDINPTRHMPREKLSESPGSQWFTQDLDLHQNMSSPLTSFLGEDDGSKTEGRASNPSDSPANTHEDNGNQQQERRGGFRSDLLRRFTSLVTCTSRRKRGKTLREKGQEKKPP